MLLPGLFQPLEQFLESRGIVNRGESIEITSRSLMGELGAAVQVSDAPAQLTPGTGPFAVALLAP
jgi:hypothetical protein